MHLVEESCTHLIERTIISIHIAQVTGSTHYIVPGAAFHRQQSSDVLERAPQLGAEIADVNGIAVLVAGKCPGNEEYCQPIQIDPHAARIRLRCRLSVCLIEHRGIGDGALLDW